MHVIKSAFMISNFSCMYNKQWGHPLVSLCKVREWVSAELFSA
jgi:hypothetical protein